MDAVERGREAFTRRSWAEAHVALASAPGLAAGDLERLATAAYMLALEGEYAETLERAHLAHLEAGSVEPAVRCAFWLSLHLLLRGEAARSAGWLARGRRLLDHRGRDGVERGYLQMLAAFAHDDEAGLAAAARVGERFGEADLVALSVHQLGHTLIAKGRIEEGVSLLDEAMVAVTAGELSPIATGLVYCSVIDGCQRLHDLRRAQEWTQALARWCGEQPEIVAFTGRCLVHRAEIMQVHGAWDDALEEAREAARRAAEGPGADEAFYRQGELHRLRGEFAAAEQAYRDASRCGRDPQPGFALLRLAQGRPDAAAAAIRRVVEATSDPLERAMLLPAHVEIALAAGELDEAREACRELGELAAGRRGGMLPATAGHARGAVALAANDPRTAAVELRRAATAWHELDAPYEAARARVLLGRACRALGDDDSSALELDAARAILGGLGAAPALAELGAGPATHGLSPRELEVLRRLATGETNREIAAALVLSERTVDRHVSNLLAKLRVPSRAAATAYAYEHGLV